MRYILKHPLLVLGLALAALASAPLALATPEEETPGATLPRGELHIERHEVQVVINNGFASTQIDQVLRNPTDRPIEAAWAFPLPREAALSELSVEADGTRYVGEVIEASRAREIYAEEQQAGRTAAVAEQHAYFHYQVRITRVPARGEVTARVLYFQALDIESGVGRYLLPRTEGRTDDLERAFWTMDRQVAGRSSLDVTLRTSVPVDRLHSPSHPGMTFREEGEGTWRARLEQTGATLDRDVVLLYRLQPDLPARVELLTHRRKDAAEGTFMAVVTPGRELAPIQGGTDWVFVLDVSGSMEGEKLRLLQRGVAKALRGLDARDRFHLVTFEASARVLTPGWQPCEAQAITAAEGLLDAMGAGGSTNVHAGLQTAYRALDADRPTGILLVSDGVANVGPHHYRELIGLAREHDVRIFTFALGNSANVRLMDDMAKMTGGASTDVSVHDELGAELLLARDRLTHQALHHVEVSLDGAAVMYPRTLPSLYLGEQLVVLGRYTGSGPTELQVEARVSGEPVTWTVAVDLPAEDARNPELERLYALRAIEDLQRQSWLQTGDAGEARGAIVDLALRYSLVTDYTSMLVVEDGRKAHYGIGDANTTRRADEEAAAARRDRSGTGLRSRTGGTPLAGPQAEHAPTRWSRPGKVPGGTQGGGTLGPFHVLLVAAMAGAAGVAARRRRRVG